MNVIAVENLIKSHQVMMIKKLVAQINREEKSIVKRDARIREALKTHAGSRTNAHWKSEQANEVSYQIKNDAYMDLLTIDEVTKFLDNLHQDRFNFLNEQEEIKDRLLQLRNMFANEL